MDSPGNRRAGARRRIGLMPALGALLLLCALRRTARSLSRPIERADGADGQPGRGRFAAAPSHIPAQGLKDVLHRTYRRIVTGRVMTVAAGVTFYTLLAIFPAIAALVSLYGLFADPETIGKLIGALAGILPGGAIEVIRSQANRVASQPSGALGTAFLASLAVSLWTANSGMKAMFDALNFAYLEEEKRSFLKLNAISLAFTLSMVLLGLLTTAATVVLPYALDYLWLSGATELLLRIGRWPVLLAMVAVVIAALYRIGPSRDHARWRWITWGSSFAAVGWLLASLLFTWYTANFGSYNKTYGSLGAAMGFVTWIWLCGIVVLIGAMLDAEMEHQTLLDTTVGPPEPLGRRGAVVADTVGEAR